MEWQSSVCPFSDMCLSKRSSDFNAVIVHIDVPLSWKASVGDPNSNTFEVIFVNKHL